MQVSYVNSFAENGGNDWKKNFNAFSAYKATKQLT